jgi:hypothetical protein
MLSRATLLQSDMLLRALAYIRIRLFMSTFAQNPLGISTWVKMPVAIKLWLKDVLQLMLGNPSLSPLYVDLY